MLCSSYRRSMFIKRSEKQVGKFTWRSLFYNCNLYLFYTPVRTGSKLEIFFLLVKIILKVVYYMSMEILLARILEVSEIKIILK